MGLHRLEGYYDGDGNMLYRLILQQRVCTRYAGFDVTLHTEGMWRATQLTWSPALWERAVCLYTYIHTIHSH